MAVDAPHPRTISRPTRGFTFVEVTLSVAIVGVMLVAALQTLGAMTRWQRTRTARAVALSLAHDLASEIMQTHYADPETAGTFGPEPGEAAAAWNRSAFDDVDDYHGWVSSPPRERDGIALGEYAGFERRVTVEYAGVLVPMASGNFDPAQDTGLKRVSVEVVAPDGVVTRVATLRGLHGPSDREPASEGTFVRWIGLTLQVGADGHPLHTGVNVVNQVALEETP